MDKERGQQYTEEPPKAGPPWGFILVLAAIVIVAIVYSVSILSLKNVEAQAVFGAMAACFTVIGTLVGTYFGLKAGLDGQEKVRQTFHRATERSRQRPQDRIDGNRGQSRREPRDDQQGETRQHRDQRRVDPGDRHEWTGGSA